MENVIFWPTQSVAEGSDGVENEKVILLPVQSALPQALRWRFLPNALPDPPPLSWSTLMYVFGQKRKSGSAEEKTRAGGDCRESPNS